MNYLSLKELDTLKQQGYDLASVQKGIALALGAKPAEQVCALMKVSSNDDVILKETEKEDTVDMNTEKKSQKFNVGDVVMTKNSHYKPLFLNNKEYTVQPCPDESDDSSCEEFWLPSEVGRLIYFNYEEPDSKGWELVRKAPTGLVPLRKADELTIPAPSGKGSIKIRGLGSPKDKQTKPDANILAMPDLQYLQTLLKGQLYNLECEIDTAKGFIVDIKSYWEESTIKSDSLKHERFYLRDLRKQRNKIAKLQAKLKRIKV